MSKKVILKIRFGKPSTGCPMSEIEFDTEAERDAYLQGVDDMDGWEEYEYFEDEPTTPFCPACRGVEFKAHQVCRVNVVVTGDNMFVRYNPDGDLGSAIYDFYVPFGSYECCNCGMKFSELSELSQPEQQETP